MDCKLEKVKCGQGSEDNALSSFLYINKWPKWLIVCFRWTDEDDLQSDVAYVTTSLTGWWLTFFLVLFRPSCDHDHDHDHVRPYSHCRQAPPLKKEMHWGSKSKHLIIIATVLFVLLSSLQRSFRYLETAAGNDLDFLTKSSSELGSSCTAVSSSHNCTPGQNGTWIQDWDFARDYGQYKQPLVFERGGFIARTWGRFQPSQEAPRPWETSWRWQDASSCPIDYTLNASSWCSLVKDLSIDRILFFGDSLSDAQFESLVNILGTNAVHDFQRLPRPMRAKLVCPHAEIPLLAAKESGGIPQAGQQRVDMILSNATREFLQRNGRLLGLFNLGAHYHEQENFQHDFNLLIRWIESMAPLDSLLFFRTTPSGHAQCIPRSPRRFNFTKGQRVEPLHSLDDFVVTEKFGWHLFAKYNEYAREKLKNHHHRFHLLDVVPMTLLRRDGHTGGSDCLHYVSPGPVDWWNHLWYTQLKDIQRHESMCKPRGV